MLVVAARLPPRQIVEQTKEIQGGTQAALADQREQMRRIEDDLDKVNGMVQRGRVCVTRLAAAVAAAQPLTQLLLLPIYIAQMGQDLTYSERLLRFMKLCCCVGFFCSCCTEPARNAHDKQWHGAGCVFFARALQRAHV